MHRLFFALWPPVELRSRIARIAEDCVSGTKARVTPVDSVHLTLVFLGNVPTERVPALSDLARECGSGSFELTFDSLERWRGGILSLLPATPPAALLTLVEMLRARLAASGYALEEREFRPHITLARDVPRELNAVDFEAVIWPVSNFCLVESTLGARGSLYRTIGSWPLA